MRRIAVLLVFALLVAACSDDSADPSVSSSTTSASTTAPTTTTSPPQTSTSAPSPEPTTASTTSTTSAPTTTSPPTTVATTTTTTISDADVFAEITLAGGEVIGVDGRLEVGLDEEVELIVTSDIADEIHVHGYDLFADLIPGETTRLRFVADIPGIFEVELEASHDLLLELQVG